MSSNASSTADGPTSASGLLITAAFLAAFGPMLTVPSLRRLVMETHGGSPTALHLYVALGMFGGAVGAPLVARRADRSVNFARLAIALALVDAAVEASTSWPIPTLLLYALRPLHGAVSMGLLAILFAQFRRRSVAGLSRGASATIIALALGPAIGGILAKHGPAVPFRLASLVSLSVVPLLFLAKTELTTAVLRPHKIRPKPRLSSASGVMRKIAPPWRRCWR